jgi:hypothetical protein
MGKRLQTVLREAAKRIDFESPSLSFRRIREAANRLADLHEANSESTFAWLLRSAVQEFSNRVYTDMPVIYPNFVTEVTSRRRSEVYGGLYRPNLPNQVDAGEKFRDTSFKGFERELVNYKYGHIITFERELFDDDQTGQIRSRAADLGEGFRIYEEIFVISRLFGLERTEEGVDVPASTYNGGTVFSTTIGNRPTSFARLSDTTLEAAHVAARSITDPLGRKFLHTPKVLIVSPIDEFAAFRLINSPAMPTTSAGTFSAMVNPLQGRYTVFSSPFVPSKAWLVGDPKRGFVFQRRDPLEIIQENPASGQSFIQEVYAFRGRERFNADWIEPRFAYLGNDGSV